MNYLNKSIYAIVTCITCCGFSMSAQSDNSQPVEVSLESAGSLGVEVLYVVNKLDDVTNLKVSGPLNDKDWTTLSNMNNIVALDLSGASATAIPEGTFKNRSSLATFVAPAGVTSIGDNAFYATGLTAITIPESVTTMGKSVFYNCTQLASAVINSSAPLGSYVFYECSNLVEVSINGDVPSIGNNCFSRCSLLNTINLPECLAEIGSSAFDSCSALTDIVFPAGLRKIMASAFAGTGLTKLTLPFNVEVESSAFYSCRNLEEITLPGTQFNYIYQFSGCNKIKKIVCPAGTPPTVRQGYDPFSNAPKEEVRLIVPSFSVVNYKLDTYWMQFGTIEGGVTSDRWSVNGELAMTNNRRFEGKPAIDIYSEGKLTVGGAAPMDLSEIRFHHASTSSGQYNIIYGQLINNSPSMTADTATIELECGGGQWYYISMPCNINMSDVSHSEGSDFVFRYYDGETRAASGTGASWKDVEPDGVLEAGKGYIYQSYSQGKLILTAGSDEAGKLLASGDRVAEVSAWSAENQANAGWNLIGNPYMSYYNLGESTLSCPVTLWDSSRRNYTAYSLIDDVVILTPMQAFFIQQGEADGEVTFGSEGRCFTDEGNTVSQIRSANTASGLRSVFDITIADGNSTNWGDRTRVVVNPDAALEYESNCDASKFFADNTRTAIYTIDPAGNRLAINERPIENGEVRLGLYLPAAGTFNISAPRTQGKLTLHDAVADKTVNLSAGEIYEITTDEAGNIDNRFTLIVEINDGTGIDAVSGDPCKFSVTTGESEIAVKGQHGVKVTVCTIDGRVVAEDVMAADGCNFRVAEGLYIVNCNGEAVKCVVK